MLVFDAKYKYICQLSMSPELVHSNSERVSPTNAGINDNEDNDGGLHVHSQTPLALND